MTHDPVLYIIHILDEIEKIQKFNQGGSEELINDEKTYYAVLRALQTTTDAAKQLPEDIKSKYPNIEWKKIWGFRNILAHDYLGDLDKETICNIVQNKLPELKAVMLKELPNWKEFKKKSNNSGE